MRTEVAKAGKSKCSHWSLDTLNSAIYYSTVETNKKTDFICSVVYSFHKDPMLQGAIAAASASALPTGALQERASKLPIRLSSLPPSLSPSFPPIIFPSFKTYLLATSVFLARPGNVHLNGNMRQMNDRVSVLLHKDSEQMLAIGTTELLWTLPGVCVL